MANLCPTCLGRKFVYSPGGRAPKLPCPTCCKGERGADPQEPVVTAATKVTEASAAKHTPGPWVAGTNPDWTPDVPWAVSRELVVRPAGEFPHGRWVADCGVAFDEEQEANARLIAAAPDLLAAARRYIEICDLLGLPDDENTAATRAAIAKALGQDGEPG